MPAPDLVIGVDVGGTRTKLVALTTDGTVVDTAVEPTQATPGPAIVEAVAAQVRSFSAGTGGRRAPLGVGVVVPGLVEEATGRAVWSANLGWRDLELRRLLGASLGLPVAVGHDVRAGLVGEVRFGAARGAEDVLFVPLGTGIAGALLSGGSVATGSEWTGEIGHVTVDQDGPLCGCGRRGCLEAVASASALGRAWRAAGGTGDAEDVATALAGGDSGARAIWDRAVAALVQVVAPVVAVAGTRVLLLGGGLVNAGPLLLDPVRDSLHSALGHDRVDVRAAALGDRAGALGAAVLALDLSR